MSGTAKPVDPDQSLLKAAEKGDLDALKEAISKGANVNCKQMCGSSPYSKFFAWQTPLHYASREGNVLCVEYLLKSLADPNCRTKWSEITPLHKAKFGGGGTLKCCQLLIEHKADVNAVDYEGARPIHRHCRPLVVLELLKSKALIDVVDNERNTTLHKAASEGNVDLLKLLLEWPSEDCLQGRKVFREWVFVTQKRFPYTVAQVLAEMMTPLNDLDACARNSSGRTALDVAKSAHEDSSILVPNKKARLEKFNSTYVTDHKGAIMYLMAYNARSD